jgi:hypothetical protein
MAMQNGMGMPGFGMGMPNMMSKHHLRIDRTKILTDSF